MRKFVIFAGAIALTALSAAPPLAAQTPSANARVTLAPGVVDAEFLTGLWGDNGDCAKWIDFRRDGVFVSYTGGQGNWRLNGDTLTLAGTSAITIHVSRTGEGQIRVVNADGTVGMSQRCPGRPEAQQGKSA